MPTHDPRRSAALVFAAFVVLTVAVAFVLGHLSGRWAVARHYARFSHDEDWRAAQNAFLISAGTRIREDEYVELREALERHRAQAPAEQRAGIEASLRVMRESRIERGLMVGKHFEE